MALAYSKNFTYNNHNYNLFYNMQQYVSPPNYWGADKIPIQFQVLGYGSGSSYTFGYYLILSDNTNVFDETLGSVFDSHNILLQQGTISAPESGSTGSDNIQTITFSKEYSTELSKFPNTATLYVKIVLTPTRANDTVAQQNISFNYSQHPALRPVFTLEDPVVLKRQHPFYNTPESWGLTQNVSVFTIETSQIRFGQNATFKSANFQIIGSDVNVSTTSLSENGTIDILIDKPISVSGDLVFRMTVIDSRNISSIVDKVVKVYSYKLPSISSFDAMRANDDKTLDEDGTNVFINLMGKADITQSNFIRSLSIIQIVDMLTGEVVSYDPDADIEIVNSLTQNPDASNQYNIGKVSYFIKGNLFEPDREYKITAGIVDEYVFIRRPPDVPTFDTKVYRSYCTIDLLAGGMGIAFGTTATKEGFECDMVADFNKTLNVDGNTTLNGTLNVAQATNLKNGLTVTGNSVFNGQIKITSVNTLDLPANSQILKGGGRTFSRTYQNGASTGHYHCIATTGKITGHYTDFYALLLVQEHYALGKSGILEVGYRAHGSGTAGGGSIRWLVNDGWSNTQFTLKCRTTSGNACADLWVYLSDWEEVNVTVLSAGSRNNMTNGQFYLRYDNHAGAASNSIPAAATDGGGNYNQTLNSVTASMMAHFANPYWGLMSPTRNSNDWIRTTETGLIPYKAGGGSSSLGTASWPFNMVVTQHLDLGPAGAVERVKDVVVAEGESNGWIWRKWASGIAEIIGGWKSFNIGASTSDNWHWISYAPSFSLGSWPFTFYQSGPSVVLNIEDNNSRYWAVRGADTTTAGPVITPITAQGYGAQAIGVTIYARGYWRAPNFNRI